MHKLAELIARYPHAPGLVFAAIGAFGAWNAYHAGMRAQEIRCMVGDSARAASEALGG